MLKYLRGWVLLELHGAGTERCLNRLTAADVPFWNPERTDELTLRLRIYESDLARARREITRALCVCRILDRRGFRRSFGGLRRRPVLLAGLVLAVALACLAQNLVWFIRVEGNERVPARRILQELAEEGVTFWAWGPDLDSQYLKNRMLNRIPELRWLAVNREGGIAHVAVAERTPREPSEPTGGAANLVAARPGVVTELRVLEGFAAVEPGDAVTEGQLLVSGLADWTTHTQVTRARGEVYADTLRTLSLKTPALRGKKTYTGRVETCRTVIFQRFRRKISGNSGIFGMSCDKMIKTTPLTLPGGFVLPVSVETATLREYTLTQVPLSQSEAEALLDRRARLRIQGELTAGEIRSVTATITKERGSFLYRGELYCRELISRTEPVLLFGEDETTNGENHQRGADGTDYQRVRLLR